MKRIKSAALCLLAAGILCCLCACVDQHPEEGGGVSAGLDGRDGETPRIIATSHATLMICDRLGLPLIAIPATSGEIPDRYRGLPEIGTAMSPDAEAIALLEPTDVIGPDALAENIEPLYLAAGVPYTFLDLQSVEGMYGSIRMLGEKYGAEKEAAGLIAEYQAIMEEFRDATEGRKRSRVLVLMGLPGAYIECTPNSYVGSLVELAGAENVVQTETGENFVSWNTEELLKLDPDVILLTAHGMPELAMEMFAEEFATNDIWKHFRAVSEDRVYQLDYTLFGMSCTFEWPQALAALKEILYDGSYGAYNAEEAYLESNP